MPRCELSDTEPMHSFSSARLVPVAALLLACASPRADTMASRDVTGASMVSPADAVGRPVAPMSPARLEALVMAFAHDSMGGREAGSEGARKAARFLAAELADMGLRPAGDDGTWFQSVPLVARSASPSSSVKIGDAALLPGTDFLAARPALRPHEPRALEVIVAGRIGQSQSTWANAEQLRGRAALFLPPAAATLQMRRILPSVPGPRSVVAHAAAIIYVLPDPIDEAQRQAARASIIEMSLASQPRAASAPPTIFISPAAAERMLGTPESEASVGDRGRRVTIDVRPHEEPRITWNVVAVIPGSDPALSRQYVAIGAHLDHIGTGRATDADSVRAWAVAARELRRANGWRPPAREELAAIRVNVDSLRPGGVARRDSIYNGADDDASGSVAMLEIARSLRALRPRRSILLVWHTAEELGLYGAQWFTEHPTVPRDSIVAQLNLDMIGRGTAADLRSGGPGYLELIGARRLSTELGDIIDAVNAERPRPFALDYTMDAPGHPEQIYCRSDHYMYARFGIPVAFFTTGGHVDYHYLTDEAQYIDYEKLAEVSRLVHDVALRVANREARPRVDGPMPDPDGDCRQ